MTANEQSLMSSSSRKVLLIDKDGFERVKDLTSKAIYRRAI
jgi:hypothetical protein